MGRRNRDRQPQGPSEFDTWSGERTLAAAEADTEVQENASSEVSDTRCICGSEELLLEAYLQVVAGRPMPKPVEVETLTCPQCGREYEAILAEDGRILRGELLGMVELD